MYSNGREMMWGRGEKGTRKVPSEISRESFLLVQANASLVDASFSLNVR